MGGEGWMAWVGGGAGSVGLGVGESDGVGEGWGRAKPDMAPRC
jgi:hypothetical protein